MPQLSGVVNMPHAVELWAAKDLRAMQQEIVVASSKRFSSAVLSQSGSSLLPMTSTISAQDHM